MSEHLFPEGAGRDRSLEGGDGGGEDEEDGEEEGQLLEVWVEDPEEQQLPAPKCSLRRRRLVLRISVHQWDKALRIRLTAPSVQDARGGRTLTKNFVGQDPSDDDDDLLFLEAELSPEDYGRFKEKQGLLVDMSGFPGMAQRLVEMCAADSSGARFFANLTSAKELQFIEVNAFRRLVHLSVQFRRGTEPQIRNYLTKKLAKLQRRLNARELQLEACRRQRDDLKATVSGQAAEIRERSASEKERMSAEVEKVRAELEQEKRLRTTDLNLQLGQFKEERRRQQEEHAGALRQLHNQVASLEYENKDLCEKRHRHEATISGLREEASRLTADIRNLKVELEKKSAESDRMGRGSKELDAAARHLQSRLSELEKENIRLSQDASGANLLMRQAQDEAARLQVEVQGKAGLVAKREAAVRNITHELVKANEAIKKLKEEVKKQAQKAQIAQQIVAEQEKVVERKGGELEELRERIRADSEASLAWRAERQELVLAAQRDREELDKLGRTVKTGESVIQWLNKQLTAAKVRDPGLRISGPPPKSMATDFSLFAASPTGIPVASTPIVGLMDKENRGTVSSRLGSAVTTGAGGHPDAFLDPKYLQPSRGSSNSRTAASAGPSGGTGSSKKAQQSGMAAAKRPPVESVYFS